MYTRRAFLGTFSAGFLGLGSYACAYEPMVRLVVTRYDIATPRWPSLMAPLRIAVIADIHAADPWMSVARIADVVAATNALQPDITLLLGDYVCTMPFKTGAPTPQQWAAPLKDLVAPLGVHAVLGNHDYWWPLGVAPVQAALENVGIPVYVNRATRIEGGGRRFWLGGTTSALTNPMYGFPRSGGAFGGLDDVPGTLSQITDDLPVIHMAHEPDLWRVIPDRVLLTIAGHTHGGQVALPLIGRPALRLSHAQYGYGHYVKDDRHLIVSGGLGCSRLPVRLGVPPEIVMITLRSDAVAQTS